MFLRSFFIQTRNYASPNRIKPFKMPKVWPQPNKKLLNLRERGWVYKIIFISNFELQWKYYFSFLRPNKAYDPPKNVGETVRKLADELGGVDNFPEKKFELLKNCFVAFQHSVPNSQLHEIKNIGKFIAFRAIDLN